MEHKLWKKLAMIGGVFVLLALPLMMTQSLVYERSSFRYTAEQDIAQSWTGAQWLGGPVMVIPYAVRYTANLRDSDTGRYQSTTQLRWHNAVFMPQTLQLNGDVQTQLRWRGIYSVPVYSGQFRMEGTFPHEPLDAFQAATPDFERWGTPSVNLLIEDVRGIGANPSLSWNGAPLRFQPGASVPSMGGGIHANVPELGTDTDYAFLLDLTLRGSSSLSIAPVAGQASIALRSPWQHPKFSGRFLPTDRQVAADGFTANWALTSFSTDAANNLRACLAGECGELKETSIGVQFIQTVDLYQKISRATKYGALFILLTFTAFVLTEILTGRRLHAVHYGLVGASLAIFYLLLLSLSEHLGFTQAFAIATGASVVLIVTYLSGVFDSLRIAMAYGSGIALLDTMLFAILRSEDFALLMGSALLFVLLGAVMMLTRRVNWYALGTSPGAARPVPSGNAG